MQAGKTDHEAIASCRGYSIFHVVLQHRQGLLRHGRPDITAVCPRAAIVQVVIAEIDEQLLVHTGVLGKIPVHPHNSEARRGSVPLHVRGGELHVFPDRRLSAEKPGRSPLGNDRRIGSPEKGGIPLGKFKGEDPQQTVIAVRKGNGYPGAVAPHFPHRFTSVLIVEVSSHSLSLRQGWPDFLYHRPGKTRQIVTCPFTCHAAAFQPVNILMPRIASVISPVVHHLHRQYQEHGQGEGQSYDVEH